MTRPTGYRVDIYDVDGRHVRGITRDYRAVAINGHTIEEVKSRIQAHVDSMRPANRRRDGRTLFRSLDEQATIPLPPLFAPLGRLFVSRDGSFWVERRDAGSPAEYRARQSS